MRVRLVQLIRPTTCLGWHSFGVCGVFEGALNRLFIVFKYAPNRLFVLEGEGSLKGCIVLGEINKTAVP